MTPGSNEPPQSSQPSFADLISLSEAVEISGLSPSQLRLLVAKGVIWGKKIGRNWLTTRKAVEDYLKTEHKPGPKPKKPDKSPCN